LQETSRKGRERFLAKDGEGNFPRKLPGSAGGRKQKGGMCMERKVFVSNSFSPNMISSSLLPAELRITELQGWEVKEEVTNSLLSEGFVSAVSYKATAKLMFRLLGINIPANRRTVVLKPGDKLIVFQKEELRKAKCFLVEIIA